MTPIETARGRDRERVPELVQFKWFLTPAFNSTSLSFSSAGEGKGAVPSWFELSLLFSRRHGRRRSTLSKTERPRHHGAPGSP
jgi:hypothetical protein